MLCNLTLMPPENLYHFSNLLNNFWFHTIWHRQSMAARIFCSRLAQSDVIVMLLVTCMVWIHWWYDHTACLVSSSATLEIPITFSQKRKCTSSNASQVKNQWNTINIEEKLDVISQLEKGEQIVDTCSKVRLTHNNICTICDNADRIKKSVKCLDNI
jgi:hypothetical protein